VRLLLQPGTGDSGPGRIGLETTTYVRNIYKYYTAYKLTLAAQQAQRAAREKLGK